MSKLIDIIVHTICFILACIGIFFLIKGIGGLILNTCANPNTEYIKQETIGNIISIEPNNSFLNNDEYKYKINYPVTKNTITTIETEDIYENEIIIDDSLEKPIAVKNYYEKFRIFKTNKVYLKMSTPDFKNLKSQKKTTY